MKQIVKYRLLTISNKLTMEIRITINESSQYITSKDDSKYINLNFGPVIGISIIKPDEIDENGNRIKSPWNINNHITMTKYNLPILYEELHGIQQDMKRPELYTYHGKRLEINETIAEEIRRVFMIGNTTIELSALVIIQPDETRVEGIKMKFNNEQSTVLLTLNELNSLVYNINHIDIDSLAVSIYGAFIDISSKSNISSNAVNVDFPLPNIDIVPKDK